MSGVIVATITRSMSAGVRPAFSLARGVNRHVGGGLAGSCDSALPYAGAGDDPFVAGIDQFREIVVGEDFFGNVTAGRPNGDPGQGRRRDVRDGCGCERFPIGFAGGPGAHRVGEGSV